MSQTPTTPTMPSETTFVKCPNAPQKRIKHLTPPTTDDIREVSKCLFPETRKTQKYR
jgi:hypothetical protein